VSKSAHDIYLKEMRKRIRKVYRQKGVRRANQSSPGEELRLIVKEYRKTLNDIPSDLELWVALFDEAAAFWLAVWATYRERLVEPADKRLLCLMTLGGRALQDILCVRELIVGGFFVQSNVVTRSLIEAIDVMHLISSHPELAGEFAQTKDNDRASEFWHEHCARGRIGKLVKTRWLWFFNGAEEPAVAFPSVRQNYIDLMGMSAHPSFGASFSTFMDSQKVDSNIAKNAMGVISPMSKFTIHLILLRVFEYGILWAGPENAIYKGDDQLANKSTLHENLSKGLNMMLSIVMMLNERSDGDPFFPEFKTYWPQVNFK
jgi:hypothetical protein